MYLISFNHFDLFSCSEEDPKVTLTPTLEVSVKNSHGESSQAKKYFIFMRQTISMSTNFYNVASYLGLVVLSLSLSINFSSCRSEKTDQKDEQIEINQETNISPDTVNSIQDNITLNQIATSPHSVVLTGMPDHRLIPVYKSKKDKTPSTNYYSSREYYSDEFQENKYHFMPGISLIYGFNLLNVAHYSFQSEKTNFLFDHPVLIKSLYYPSLEQDSLDKKPVTRNYYLISVYDEDTNKDTLLNKKDLRRIYHFDAFGLEKTQIVPADYSVVKSQYDAKNDVMYIFARKDTNKNGSIENNEPMHIFWISLKSPAEGKLLY